MQDSKVNWVHRLLTHARLLNWERRSTEAADRLMTESNRQIKTASEIKRLRLSMFDTETEFLDPREKPS